MIGAGLAAEKPTQKNPPKKTQKNPPKKTHPKVGFFGFFWFFGFYRENFCIELFKIV